MLMIDVNDHAYTSRFVKALAAEEIQMKCLFFKRYGQRVPFSHKTGSKIPIMTAYASPGFDCEDMFVFKHEYGLGDHQLFGIDLTMQSVFGCSAPTPPRRAGRLLQAKIKRIRDPYNNSLEKRIQRHRLDEKADNLHEVQTFIEQHNLGDEYQDILQSSINLLDKEHVEHEIGSEKNCRKIKNCNDPFCPQMNDWRKRKQVYQWLERYQQGRNVNIESLAKACARHQLPHPDDISIDDVQKGIYTSVSRSLKSSARWLQRCASNS